MYERCPKKNCPLEMPCEKSCYWWNENDRCDWSLEAEQELEKGTEEQIRQYELEQRRQDNEM